MVGRKVSVNIGVRVAGKGVTPGSNVGGIAVGPSVFRAKGSREAVGEGKRVTVGSTVFDGPTVGVFRKDKSTGRAEHPVMMMARRRVTVFFMVPQILCWDYCIN
jgi:hypothetical protein